MILKQYQSEGIFRQHELIVNPTIRTRALSLFGYYVLNFANSDTGGMNSFPSHPYNIGADYGRASFDRRNRLFLGGNFSLPYNISLSPFIMASSGRPYNVTLGSDFNKDSVYNDRPAFATPGQDGAKTLNGCGTFVGPQPGDTPSTFKQIPINYCTGPALFTTNLRVGKTFGFGPMKEQANTGGPGGGGEHGGHHGGRGMFGGGSNTGHKYNLTLSASVQNLFNNHNYSVPNATLGSAALFGKTTQLAGRPFTSNAALRQVSFNASFNF